MSKIPVLSKQTMKPVQPLSENLNTPANTQKSKIHLAKSAPACKSKVSSTPSTSAGPNTRRQGILVGKRAFNQDGTNLEKNVVPKRAPNVKFDVSASSRNCIEVGTSTETSSYTDISTGTEVGIFSDIGTATEVGAFSDVGTATDNGSFRDTWTGTDVRTFSDIGTATEAEGGTSSVVATATDVSAFKAMGAFIDVSTTTDRRTSTDASLQTDVGESCAAEVLTNLEVPANAGGSKIPNALVSSIKVDSTNAVSDTVELTAHVGGRVKNSGNPSSLILCTRGCSQVFLNRSMAKLHERYTHDEIWTCAICTFDPVFEYGSRRALCKHLSTKHQKYWTIMDFLKRTSRHDRFEFSLLALETPWVHKEHGAAAIQAPLSTQLRCSEAILLLSEDASSTVGNGECGDQKRDIPHSMAAECIILDTEDVSNEELKEEAGDQNQKMPEPLVATSILLNTKEVPFIEANAQSGDDNDQMPSSPAAESILIETQRVPLKKADGESNCGNKPAVKSSAVDKVAAAFNFLYILLSVMYAAMVLVAMLFI